MVVMRNMDELFDMDLSKDSIAAAHVCACNPRKLPHYPTDWLVIIFQILPLTFIAPGCRQIVLIPLWNTPRV